MELQRARLQCTTPGGPLGELDADADMTMSDLLLQFLLRFGKRPPLRLVRGENIVQFAIGDCVMEALPPVLQQCSDGDALPIELTLVAMDPKEVWPKKTQSFWELAEARKGKCGGKGGGKGGATCKKGKGRVRHECEDQRWLLEAWALDSAVKCQRASLNACLKAGVDIDYRYEQLEISHRDPGSHGECKVTGESMLYSAVMRGDEPLVRLLIECRAGVGNLTAFDMYDPGFNALHIRETVLHAAVKRGDAKICRILLEAKACANRGLEEDGGDGRCDMHEKTLTPLHVAVQKEDETLATELCRMLLDYRADPNEGLVAVFAQSCRWSRARRERPARVAKSQQCKDLLRKASELWPCCDAAWRGWLCQTCGTRR